MKPQYFLLSTLSFLSLALLPQRALSARSQDSRDVKPAGPVTGPATAYPSAPRMEIPDSVQFPEVDMNEYMITTPGHFTDIESAGATTCVMVTLWDPQTGTGVLAHVSASIDVPRSFAQIFATLKAAGVNPAGMQAHMIGGWKGWSESIVKALDQTLARAGVRVVERDVLNPFVPAKDDLRSDAPLLKLTPEQTRQSIKAIVLSLADGHVYDYTESVVPSMGRHQVPPITPLLQKHPLSL